MALIRSRDGESAPAPSSDDSSRRLRRETLVCAIAVFLACLSVHARALDGFFLADDYTIIGSFWGKDLPHLLGLVASDEIGGLWNERFVRPMRPWTLALDAQLWRLEPLGFHLTNLLLHAFASTLIAALVLQLGGGGLVSALLASLLFAVHPLNVEVAAWIASRDESLSGAMLLAALACHLEAEASRRRRLWVFLSLVCFAVSLFSKEYGILFPVALVAWSMVQGRPIADALRAVVPYFGVVALFLGVRWMGIGHFLGGYGSSGEAHRAFQVRLLWDALVGFVRDLLSPSLARPLPAAAAVLGVLLLVDCNR